jgi:hypothetical protein
METIYSLAYALKKYKYDPDCDLFLGCLDKMLPQDLRGVQPIITNEVLLSCRKRDLRVHKETLGYLSLDDLLRALKDVKIFLYKSDEAFLALQVVQKKGPPLFVISAEKRCCRAALLMHSLQDALALEAEDTSQVSV